MRDDDFNREVALITHAIFFFIACLTGLVILLIVQVATQMRAAEPMEPVPAETVVEVKDLPADIVEEEGELEENQAIEKALILRAEKIENCKITYYCACEKCCGKYADGITATGTRVSKVTCAVDPKVIPLGATVMLDYDNDGLIDDYRIAEDTGGAIKGNRIDVFCESHQEALQMGVQMATVHWVVEE